MQGPRLCIGVLLAALIAQGSWVGRPGLVSFFPAFVPDPQVTRNIKMLVSTLTIVLAPLGTLLKS